MRETCLHLHVEPRGLSPQQARDWDKLKSLGCKMRRGVGKVMGATFGVVRFSEIWVLGADGLAMYASGDTDGQAVEAAARGNWVQL